MDRWRTNSSYRFIENHSIPFHLCREGRGDDAVHVHQIKGEEGVDLLVHGKEKVTKARTAKNGEVNVALFPMRAAAREPKSTMRSAP